MLSILESHEPRPGGTCLDAQAPCSLHYHDRLADVSSFLELIRPLRSTLNSETLLLEQANWIHVISSATEQRCRYQLPLFERLPYLTSNIQSGRPSVAQHITWNRQPSFKFSSPFSFEPDSGESEYPLDIAGISVHKLELNCNAGLPSMSKED